jgi:hypothetical protein
LFNEENEKYYYNYLKYFFLKDNFYDTFISDNYINNINYSNFVYNLKKKVFKKKYYKISKKIEFRENIFFSDLNVIKIKNDLINNTFLK